MLLSIAGDAREIPSIRSARTVFRFINGSGKALSTKSHRVRAKEQFSRCHEGYRIVGSEVIRSYDDDAIQQRTPSYRKR
jgi:hypothetical protein